MKENKLPLHIGIIMDGNGRWAKQRGIFLGGFSETGAVPKYKKTPVRPHFDKSQKGNMFSDCGAMYVT